MGQSKPPPSGNPDGGGSKNHYTDYGCEMMNWYQAGTTTTP